MHSSPPRRWLTLRRKSALVRAGTGMAAPGQQRGESVGPMAPAAPVVATDAAGVAIRDGLAGPTILSNGVSHGDCLQGRFVIEGELGRGGGGTVFVARDRVLDRLVAIKILSRPADPEAVARFAQEARAAGALEHANVLVVHDVGVDRGAPFIVSELLRGRTLRARLVKGPLSP